ncbi:hypothetical protein BJ741DRAFT_612674 [Chytriomyces cf. hyalinus JEL632]|nr:hypothetical protein BJ741DRAFT_612674 [Chytriomyces cf. hyalinus JEL632]
MNADGISASKKQPVRGILKGYSHSLSDYAADSSANKYKSRLETLFSQETDPHPSNFFSHKPDSSGMDNLMMTEAQKNSTMKIDEPKTPYIHYNALTDEIVGHSGAIPPMELSSALDDVKDAQQKMSAGGSASSSMLTSDTSGTRSTGGPHFTGSISGGGASGDWDDDEGDSGMKEMTAEEREKHEKFERMRSQHYDMKLKLAAARKQIQDEESGEDADNDDGNLDASSDGDDDDDYEDESDDEDGAQAPISKSEFGTESLRSMAGRNPNHLKEDEPASMSSNSNNGGSADRSESISSKKARGNQMDMSG